MSVNEAVFVLCKAQVLNHVLQPVSNHKKSQPDYVRIKDTGIVYIISSD